MDAKILLANAQALFACLSSAKFDEETYEELGRAVYHGKTFTTLSTPLKAILLRLVGNYEARRQGSEETTQVKQETAAPKVETETQQIEIATETTTEIETQAPIEYLAPGETRQAETAT